jgi:hypothetical protein
VTFVQWWQRGPAPLRWRRRLLAFSAPVAVLVVVVIVKAVSVVIAGDSASAAYTHRDTGALRGAVGSMNVLNVIEPAKTSFAAGDLAVLDNRLEDADRSFAESLARSEAADSCPVRVNLELVRETLGDRAAAVFDDQKAQAHYLSARTLVDQAPQGCFAANTDPDPQRKAVRNDTAPRLDGKIEAVRVALPPPLPPPEAPAPPPRPLPNSAAAPADPDTQLRLNPGAGAPLDRLQQILRDAAAQRGG